MTAPSASAGGPVSSASHRRAVRTSTCATCARKDSVFCGQANFARSRKLILWPLIRVMRTNLSVSVETCPSILAALCDPSRDSPPMCTAPYVPHSFAASFDCSQPPRAWRARPASSPLVPSRAPTSSRRHPIRFDHAPQRSGRGEPATLKLLRHDEEKPRRKLAGRLPVESGLVVSAGEDGGGRDSSQLLHDLLRTCEFALHGRG